MLKWIEEDLEADYEVLSYTFSDDGADPKEVTLSKGDVVVLFAASEELFTFTEEGEIDSDAFESVALYYNLEESDVSEYEMAIGLQITSDAENGDYDMSLGLVEYFDSDEEALLEATVTVGGGFPLVLVLLVLAAAAGGAYYYTTMM